MSQKLRFSDQALLHPVGPQRRVTIFKQVQDVVLDRSDIPRTHYRWGDVINLVISEWKGNGRLEFNVVRKLNILAAAVYCV